MPKLYIKRKISLVPEDTKNPPVSLKVITRTIDTVGDNFSRAHVYVSSGSTQPAYAKVELPIGTDIGDIGYILIENIGGVLVGIGSNPEISGNITDGGGGLLNIYSVGHGLNTSGVLNYKGIVINGSIYSGYYDVTKVDDDNYTVVEVFTSNESSVPIYSSQLCEMVLDSEEFSYFRLNSGSFSSLYAISTGGVSSELEVIAIED